MLAADAEDAILKAVRCTDLASATFERLKHPLEPNAPPACR
jgi:hypothetical protein